MSHTSHQHVTYHLSCDQFEAMLARAEGRCELRGEVFTRTPDIDHDHEIGFRGVRGLVCKKCNDHLRRVDSGERPMDDLTRAYLDASWHLSIPRSPRPYYLHKDKDPQHSVRISAELWNPARERATQRGEDVSDVVRKALERYVKRA